MTQLSKQATPTIEEIRREWANNMSKHYPSTKFAKQHIDFLLGEVDKLKTENAAFGEFICRRCHLRQDSEPVGDPQF